jgi:hypothetical protein
VTNIANMRHAPLGSGWPLGRIAQTQPFSVNGRFQMSSPDSALQPHFVKECIGRGFSRATISALEKGRAGDDGVRKVMKILDYLGYEVVVREQSPFPTLEELRGD